MINYRIFAIDDEPSIRQGISFGLGKSYEIETFATAEEALPAILEAPPDLVLLDIGLPGMSGLEALDQVKQIDHNILAIMITAYEDFDTVIAAMKSGAHDYLIKPIDMGALRIVVQNALETIRLRKELQALQEQSLRENIPCFIGQSNAIQNVMDYVNKVAASPDTPILITGASGTGKELIAKTIHYKSPNFKGGFVALNCAAIAKDLVESELFGYEKGAFTGADAKGKMGLIEKAANGTLFLDEVGDLSLQAQAKLLRFLQEGEYFRVGGTKQYKTQTRIVSATNQDLNAMVDDGRLRLDLYFRLAVVKVEIPSLNERPDDIIPIAESFLLEFSRKHGKTFHGISDRAKTFLTHRRWKGNIRELRNFIERGTLLGEGPILTLDDIAGPGSKTSPKPSSAFDRFPPLPDDGIALEKLEGHYIREALKKTGGNDAQAAQLLKMKYYAFRYQKKKHLK